MADRLRLERRGPVAWCTLDHAPLNLLDRDTIAALQETFTTLARDRGVRVAVLGGAHRAFTAGVDVRAMRDLDPAGARRFIGALHDALDAVHRAPFPVVAALHGACLGGGFELALACDLRIATDDAALGLPEVRVGVPSVIHAALLPAIVGAGRAADLLFLGRALPAAEALAWGLVNRMVPAAGLTAAVQETVDAILACGPEAIRLQKALVVRWRETGLASAVRAGIDAFAATYATDEPREGMSAFLEKRPPRFGDGA